MSRGPTFNGGFNERKDEILRGLHGFYERGSLSDALVRQSEIGKGNEFHIDDIGEILRTQDIHIPPQAWPEHFASTVEKFSAEDWEFIKKSPSTLVSLYAVHNYYSNYYEIERFVHGVSDVRSDRRYSIEENQTDEARLHALPLVHGTTLANLENILGVGRIKTNRELFDENQRGVQDFLEASQQRTTALDRELGLDQYVFADFGRLHPHHPQLEVTLVLDPVLLQQQGAFLTEHDYLDEIIQTNDFKTPLRMYAQTITQTPYFYKQALAKIRSTPIQEYESGRSYVTIRNTVQQFANGVDHMPYPAGYELPFATWEAKLPSVPVSAIKKIIFKDKEQYDAFVASKRGGGFTSVWEPDLTPSSYGKEGNMAAVLKI